MYEKKTPQDISVLWTDPLLSQLPPRYPAYQKLSPSHIDVIRYHQCIDIISKSFKLHSTTILIGHFYFAVISTSVQPMSSKFSAFYTDVCSYRNPVKLASLLSRSVVQLLLMSTFSVWHHHWNIQMIKNCFLRFYSVYCCIKNILFYVNFC